MQHADLVARALQWARVTLRHRIAVQEIVGCSESPDVLAWNGQFTTLIECKASRADFLRDAQKFFRRNAEMGMGYHRYYFAPEGLLTPEEMPERWGLAVPKGRGVRILRKPEPFYNRQVESEMYALFVATVRATEGWGRKVFGDIAPPMIDGDPSPTTTAIIKKQRKEIEELRALNVRLRRALRTAAPMDPGSVDDG